MIYNNQEKDCKSNEKKRTNGKAGFENSSMKSSKTDPDGSWTGVPIDEFEKPIQDADDL